MRALLVEVFNGDVLSGYKQKKTNRKLKRDQTVQDFFKKVNIKLTEREQLQEKPCTIKKKTNVYNSKKQHCIIVNNRGKLQLEAE